MGKTKIYAMLGTLSASIAAVGSKYGIIFWAILMLLGAMIIDFLSGMLASAKESIESPDDKNKGWSSKKGTLGIIKKVGYALIVTVAIAIDFVIFKALPEIGITAPFETFFGMLTVTWFILNECLSIIENAGRMGAKNIPKFLTNAIVVLKDKVEEKSEEDSKEDKTDGE